MALRKRETAKRHVMIGELEGNYIISIARGSGVGSKLADFCNTASVGPRQDVLVRGSSEAWCRRSETAKLHHYLEAQRIGSTARDQRFLQSISLAVSKTATARAS